MPTPFFSIIIPTYHSAKTLDRCLSSIVYQDYTNLQLVIVDGGSTDETNEIIASFAQKDNRIIHTSGKDNGIYDAMNKGIGMATGEWLLFLGSDDFLVNAGVLGEVADFINNNDQHHMFYGDVRSNQLGKSTNGIYGGPFDVVKILRCNICHQGIFYNRKLFGSKLYDTQYKCFADYDFNLSCMLNANVKKEYMPILVSEYSDGGFSSTVSGDPVFLKDYAKLVIAYSGPYFMQYPSRFKFLLRFFHKSGKIYGLKTGWQICLNHYKESGADKYAALFVATLKYIFGFYFLKKKIKASEE